MSGLVAQFCSSVDVGSPPVLTWIVYSWMFCALMLSQVICSRVSIEF